MIGPADVSLTATAIRRISGDSTRSAIAEMLKLRTRFSESDVTIARQRLELRVVTGECAAGSGESKTGNEPVTITLGSAPREAIHRKDNGHHNARDLGNRLPVLGILGADHDLIAGTQRKLIERQPLIERR